jgi:hypothetical protein
LNEPPVSVHTEKASFGPDQRSRYFAILDVAPLCLSKIPQFFGAVTK